MREVVIASAARTAIGNFGGALKDVPAVELGGVVVKEVLRRARVRQDAVDKVIMGMSCRRENVQILPARRRCGRTSPNIPRP